MSERGVLATCAALVLAIGIACGVGSAVEQSLPGPWLIIANDHPRETCVSGFIDATVYSAGWNDDHVLVKRHAPIERFLLVVESEEVLGPFTAEEFAAIRTERGVDPDLDYTWHLPMVAAADDVEFLHSMHARVHAMGIEIEQLDTQMEAADEDGRREVRYRIARIHEELNDIKAFVARATESVGDE